MEQLARLGRGITIIILILVYTSIWAITSSWLNKNNDETWVICLSVFWLIIHGIALVGYFIWSWTF